MISTRYTYFSILASLLTTSLLPHIDILLWESAVEEHVEQLLGTDVSLESTRISILVVVVLPVSMVSATIVAVTIVRLIDAIQIVVLALFGIRKYASSIAESLKSLHRTRSLILVGMQLQS